MRGQFQRQRGDYHFRYTYVYEQEIIQISTLISLNTIYSLLENNTCIGTIDVGVVKLEVHKNTNFIVTLFNLKQEHIT